MIKLVSITQLSLQKRLNFIAILCIAFIAISLSGCFEKQVSCQINGVPINEQLIGKPRAFILKKLGQPVHSDLGIKHFEEYTFMANHKSYAVILHYTQKSATYYISGQKCIKTNPKIEIANHILWH
ncbi:hypothetical protein [Psychrobacter sp. I-STPA10]|uniref:hypothetical protein n=1 Tax=Psychrobacter sp. I-STPA10 TaxID=2585769 RepID=UPI001E3F9CC7|nr:hypothetical protein [Psychrobacter sp. I-STPA10]